MQSFCRFLGYNLATVLFVLVAHPLRYFADILSVIASYYIFEVWMRVLDGRLQGDLAGGGPQSIRRARFSSLRAILIPPPVFSFLTDVFRDFLEFHVSKSPQVKDGDNTNKGLVHEQKRKWVC